jgi:hypothetical protein
MKNIFITGNRKRFIVMNNQTDVACCVSLQNCCHSFSNTWTIVCKRLNEWIKGHKFHFTQLQISLPSDDKLTELSERVVSCDKLSINRVLIVADHHKSTVPQVAMKKLMKNFETNLIHLSIRCDLVVNISSFTLLPQDCWSTEFF